MNLKSKILLGLFGVAFLSLIVWAVNSVPEPPTPTPPDDSPRIMSYEDNVLNEYKDGKLLWELKAKKISMDVDTRDAEMEDITAKFFAADGRVMELTARQGKYNQDTQNIELVGDIVGKSSDGAEITGGKMAWDNAKSLLIIEESVKAKKDDMRASGDRVEISDEFNHYKIIGHAHLEKGGRDEKN